MDEHETFQESLSAGGLDDIEPFLMHLLQDLWALGGCPETAIGLLESAGVAPAAHDRVVDLGCGKGAMLIALAKRFGCRGFGVDRMPEFIDEARMLARKHGVDAQVEFEVRDMREAAAHEGQHAWIVYGHDAPIFGGLRDTLHALRRALTPGGFLILDAVCRALETSDDEAEKLPSSSELRMLFAHTGLREVAYKTMPVEDVRAANAANTAAIAARAEELKQKHPERAQLFDAYVQNQRDESAFLENVCESLYFLLRAV